MNSCNYRVSDKKERIYYVQKKKNKLIFRHTNARIRWPYGVVVDGGMNGCGVLVCVSVWITHQLTTHTHTL